MGIDTYPPSSGGGIKSVQRGSAVGSGTVTITAVDITKAFVNIFGTNTSGTVAVSGTVAAKNAAINAANISTTVIRPVHSISNNYALNPAGSKIGRAHV